MATENKQFQLARCEVLTQLHTTNKAEAREYLLGVVLENARGFVDEETREPFVELLIKHDFQFDIAMSLLAGDSFTQSRRTSKGFETIVTQLVPLDGHAFVTPETSAALLHLAERYRLESFQGWRRVAKTAKSPPPRNFEQEARVLAAETPLSPRKINAFIKDFLKEIGTKVHDMFTKRPLADVLDDTDALTVEDVFNLLIGDLVHDSYSNHQLNPIERGLAVTADMEVHLHDLFECCDWKHSKVEWCEF